VVPGRLSGLAERFAGEVRGEIVIVVGAAGEATAAEESVESVLRSLLATGMKPSAAAREAAAMTGQPRSGLYALAEQIRKADRDGQ